MPLIAKGSLWAVDRLGPLLKRKAELLGLDAVKTDTLPQNVRRVYEMGETHDDIRPA